MDVIAFKLNHVCFLWKSALVCTRCLCFKFCSLMLPGLSFGVNPPLAEPLQCVEGFNHLPEATVLIRIFLILCTDRRSTICTLGTPKIPNRKADHESFSFYPNSVSLCWPSHMYLPRPSSSGLVSGLLLPFSIWAQVLGYLYLFWASREELYCPE